MKVFEAPVRVVLKDNEPWFVAADVCKVLGIANTTLAVRSLDADERMTINSTKTQTGPISAARGGARSFIVINESGLYALITQSRKPDAKRFRKWVTGTVLPAIRKDGGYIMGEERVVSGEMGDDGRGGCLQGVGASRPDISPADARR